ncbi:MAG TPA: PHP domain-containing protein [Acholeplasmataceae bacterium]|jgi:histidinol-phosphatase (PHP family)|nr:PHP domain-containing protein [Acholeplasmataceae bacterium]
MAKTNYHNHTYLCQHAQGLPYDYIKRAVELDYDEIGMSDHGPILYDLFARMTLSEFYDIYLPDIEKAKQEFFKQIKIYKGLEIEYFQNHHQHYEMLLKDLDYLILGQHVLIHQSKFIDVFRDMNDEYLELYKDTVIEALETKYFRILAHPDIYLFGYQTWNEKTEKVARAIIEAAIRTDTLLEINANGIRRRRIINQDGEEVYLYPRKEFWTLLKAYPEAQIIINEDNHALKQIGDKAVFRAHEFAQELNLTIRDFLYD